METTYREQEIRKNLISCMDGEIEDGTLISARELWLHCVGPNKPISWIRSYKTLLKYVSETYKDVFKPVVVGQGSGTRYYIEIDNVAKFLYQFENHELDT
jgi:hypothetical protein